MRLLFVSSAFPRPREPARAPYNLRLCEALADEHEVIVISPLPWMRWTRAARGQHRVGRLCDVRYPLFLYPPGILRDTHAGCLLRSIRRAVRTATRDRLPDAVVSYWTYPDGAAAAAIAREMRAPAVMIVGGSDVAVLARQPPHRSRIADTLARADAVVTTSRSLRDAIEELGVDADRISVVRRGVDTTLFRPADRNAARQSLGISARERSLLWVGRLDAVKGPDLLIDALALVAARRSSVEWRCYIVGEGPLRTSLSKAVARRNLTARVILLGSQPASALATWYQAADAVVISSRSEGLPNVLAEAKACGVPAIATNVGGVTELADASDRIVPPDDPIALARAVEDVISGEQRGTPSRPADSMRLPSWRDSAAALTRVIERAVVSRRYGGLTSGRELPELLSCRPGERHARHAMDGDAR